MSNDIKRIIREYSPERALPLLRGVYNTIYFQDAPPQDPYLDVSRHLDISSPTVIDGGAYKGQMVEKFLDMFESPKIHAIEPLPQHVHKLNEIYKHNNDVLVHACALGDDNCDIYIKLNPKTNTSSVFETTKVFREKVKKFSSRSPFEYKPQDSVLVSQVRMDDLIEDCDIMKLDLRGYEFKALQGAKRLLENCQAIITEISFVPLYENQVLFLDLYDYVAQYDFRLYNLYVSNTSGGQIFHGDAVFLKQSVYNNSESLLSWFPDE